MTPEQLAELDWQKSDGLLPVIVQHAGNLEVLMLGYMNREALDATIASRHVTFFSRTRQRQWVKGESSGHSLEVESIAVDCDNDTLLIRATPLGPTCHRDTPSCFDAADTTTSPPAFAFLGQLEKVIAQRVTEKPDGSYTARLWNEGPVRIAQKVGEEGVEVALAAATQKDDELIDESADLIFHLILLLKSRDRSLGDVISKLQSRHSRRTA
jgi:phosphoribosyl-ATP pyrophosphohydrolase/phosphoribosyl-AMP cyclohydrolase